MLRDYDLVNCLNGLKSTYQEVGTLGKRYESLNKQFGAGKWQLSENNEKLLVSCASENQAKQYSQLLRQELAKYGDTVSIQVKQNEKNWVVELDKTLIWHQVGRLLMNEELNKYHSGVNACLNILQGHTPPGETNRIKKTGESLNLRIDGMLQQALKGYQDNNFPPYPEWFMEHQKEVKVWLTHPFVNRDIKAKLREQLPFYKTIDEIAKMLEWEKQFSKDLKENKLTTEEIKDKTAKLNQNILKIINLAEKGESQNNLVPYPDWFAENKAILDSWLQSGYVTHQTRQKLQRIVKPEDYFERSYNPQNDLIKRIWQEILKSEPSKVNLPGSYLLSLEMDGLLKKLEELDKKMMAPHLKIAAIDALLKANYSPLLTEILTPLTRDPYYKGFIKVTTMQAPLGKAPIVSPVIPSKGVQAEKTKGAAVAVQEAKPDFVFYSTVKREIERIKDPDKKALAEKRFHEPRFAALNASVLRKLNQEPESAAKFLAQSEEFMKLFLSSTEEMQIRRLNNLPERISFESEPQFKKR